MFFVVLLLSYLGLEEASCFWETDGSFAAWATQKGLWDPKVAGPLVLYGISFNATKKGFWDFSRDILGIFYGKKHLATSLANWYNKGLQRKHNYLGKGTTARSTVSISEVSVWV